MSWLNLSLFVARLSFTCGVQRIYTFKRLSLLYLMLDYQCGGYAIKHKHDSSKYYADKRITSKKTDKDDGYYRRIDQSTLPFIYIDNESATIFGNVKEIESTRELVDQHHVWFLSRLFDFQM